MSITATCGACGRNFIAPAQFQGKRVKCKGCGEVFSIPASNGSGAAASLDDSHDSLAQLAAVTDSMPGATSNSFNRSSNRSGNRSGIDEGDESRPSPSSPYSVKAGFTPNVLTFDYPGASDVDQWLPISLIILGFLLLLTNMSGGVPAGMGWIGFTRFLTPSLLYWGFVFPITLGMVRKAARELRYGMPPNYKLRCFASYMPAFVLITWTQMGGDGLTIIQLFAGIFGLAISSAVLWLLFRLREEHIGTTVAYGAGGFAAGIAICILLTIGSNKIGALVVDSQHAQASVPVSPFGEGLSWVSAPPAPVVARAIATPAVAPATKPAAIAPAIAIDAGLMGHFTPGGIPGTIDDVIDPCSSSPFVGIVRTKQSGISVECWNTQTWKPAPSTLNLPNLPAGNIVLSTDGEHLAWIAEFPRLCVQVWSFSKGSVICSVELDRSQGSPQLVDFVSTDHLIIDRTVSAPAGVVNATPVPAPKPVVAPAPTPPPVSKPGNLFDDMKENPRSHVSAADPLAKTDTGGEPDGAPAGSADADNSSPSLGESRVHQLSIIDVISGTTLCSFNLPQLTVNPNGKGPPAGLLQYGQTFAVSMTSNRLVSAVRLDNTLALLQIDLVTGKKVGTIKIAEIDPTLSGSPTALAYSNDGTNIAVMFENGGSALLLAYDAVTGAKISNFVYPAGPLDGASPDAFHGSAVCWLDPATGWLVYGQGVLNTQTGARLKEADLNLTDATRQRFIDGNRVQLVTNSPSGKKLSVLEIDGSRLQRSLDAMNH